MTRIELTDEDLGANRRSRLSHRQRKEVQVQQIVWLAGSVGLAACLVGLGVVLTLKVARPSFADRGELFVAVPVLLFWAWLLRGMPLRWRRARRDVRAGEVESVEGPVQADVEQGVGIYRPVRHIIYTGDLSFRVSRDIQRQFRPGEQYRVFYTAHGHHFLGALALVDAPAVVEPPPLLEPLTDRELEILPLLAAGMSNRQIADQLSLSVNTVKMYCSQLYQKLGVHRRTAAVARARELDIL